MTPPARPGKLGWRQYLGYASGDASNNLTFSMVSAFVLIYYTDVAGIPAAAAGTLLLVARVWGGFTDLLAGRLVDLTDTRWGRFRPYILFGALPLMVSLVAMFSIPGGLGDVGMIVWAYVTYVLFSLIYSFVNIPYGSLAAAMTQDAGERSKLASARTAAAQVTILLLAVVVAPQIEGASDLQRSLTITTVVFLVIGFGLYMFCFSSTRETVGRDAGRIGLRKVLHMVRNNKPLIVLCGAALLFLTGMFSWQTVAVYYARDVLGDANLYIVLTLVQTVGMLVAAASIPRAVSAMGKKGSYLAGGGISVIASLAVAVAPASVPVIAIVCFAILGFGLGSINTLIFAVQPDTVDHGEWNSGIRAEAASYSLLSFTRKVGQGVGGAAAAYTLGLGGYISGGVSQSDEALTAIRVAVGVVPAVAIAASTVVMLAYPLTEKAFREQVAEIAARRATKKEET